jgi:hypothetical protein
VPGYTPCPRQGICITYPLLLALSRGYLRVGGMFSRYPQQPILVVDGVLLIVPFALHHYTYLIEGEDFPIDITYIRSLRWLRVQRNKSSMTATSTMRIICADCCSGSSAMFQGQILYTFIGAVQQIQVGMAPFALEPANRLDPAPLAVGFGGGHEQGIGGGSGMMDFRLLSKRIRSGSRTT